MIGGSWTNFYKILKYLAMVEKVFKYYFGHFLLLLDKQKNLKIDLDPCEKSFLDISLQLFCGILFSKRLKNTILYKP